MILLENTLISEDILDKEFICNLASCKGKCCIEGDSGAPLDAIEIEYLQKNLSGIIPYLDPESTQFLAQKGSIEQDKDGDWVTTCLPDGKCVFGVYDAQGMLHCGIEKAWQDGKSDFQKPISCHLYPIRLKALGEYTALNYHRWDICKAACQLGKEHQTPVYKFLKNALIRKFGDAWYTELCAIAESDWDDESKA